MYQNNPFIIDETPGKKRYCTCGESSKGPYCDGAHARSNNGRIPKVVDVNENKKLAICGCGKSSASPFCDGSHLKA